MSHALSGLAAEPGRDHLIVAPHRAVEEDQRRAGQPRLEIVGHSRAGGDEIEIFAARLVLNPQAERVAGAVAAGRMALPSRYQAPLPGTSNGSTSRPEGEPSGRAGSKAFPSRSAGACTFFSPSTLKMLLDCKIASTRCAHRSKRANPRASTAARRPRRSRHWSGSRPRSGCGGAGLLGVQLRRRDQLLAQVGRGVDQRYQCSSSALTAMEACVL